MVVPFVVAVVVSKIVVVFFMIFLRFIGSFVAVVVVLCIRIIIFLGFMFFLVLLGHVEEGKALGFEAVAGLVFAGL